MFNNEINRDIKDLKLLRKKLDKKEYLNRKIAIAKKYKVSIRTIENWMTKKIPGMRKCRKDSGKDRIKVDNKAKNMAAELIKTDKQIKEIKQIIENKTCKKMSKRQMTKVRIAAEKETDKEQDSNFGDKAKELFEKLFELDLIAPDAGIRVKVGHSFITIRKEYLEDICLILANAYNNAIEVKYKVDRNELLRRNILNLIEQQVRLAMQGIVDTKSIEAITRMFDKMNQEVEMNMDIRTVEKVCKELKKDITLDEIISLLKKYSNE